MGDPSNPDKPSMDESHGMPLDADSRLWAMLVHLAALSGTIIPLGNLVGPLTIWLIKRHEMPFVDDQGRESLNFQISMMIYLSVSAALICVAVGIVTTPILAIVNVVMVILAALAANRGEVYRYPFSIRFVQ